MNRNSLALAVLVILALLVVLGLWVVPGDAPEPRRADAPVERERVDGTVLDEVGMEFAPERHREVAVVADRATPQAADTRGAAGSEDVLRGSVKEHGGVGVPDMLLELVDSTGSTIASTISGENGRFTFEQPAPAGASLVMQLVSGEGPRIRHSSIRETSRRGMRPGSSAVANVIVWVPPLLTIEGLVVDQDGRPVEGASVGTDRPWFAMGMTSWEVLDGPVLQMGRGATADADGRFVLVSTMRGTHQLRASHDGKEGSAECRAGARNVVLKLGTHLHGGVVLEGLLRARGTGVAVVGARVSVQRVRTSKGGYSAVGVATATTNERGGYVVKGLKLGQYVVSARADGFAPSTMPVREFAVGRHTVDFDLDPACELLVNVVLRDGSPDVQTKVHVLDTAGERLEVPGKVGVMTDAVSVDEAGRVRLRLLPSVPLTLMAVRGDLSVAGRVDVDLSAGAPESVTIVMPTDRDGFARKHYFRLLGAEGKPAFVEGVVVAESFDGDAILSRVEGRWEDGEFAFGHDGYSSFSNPTIAVGAMKGRCRVEIAVPGYRKEILTLEPGASSPTSVRLRR